MGIWNPKLITCMKNYNSRQLIKDVAAGILVAVIAFPLSVALAIASGLSPERGLYSGIVGGFLVSLLGGSRVNIGGATAATVMTVFTIVDQFGLSGLALASIMAGFFLIIMGFLKLGVLLKYIPRTITLGFTAGIAMGIFSGQLKGFFGLSMDAIPVKTLDRFIAYARAWNTVDAATVLVAAATMLILILLPLVTSKIPDSLAAILIMTPLVHILQIPVATINSVYGSLPSHFPRFVKPEITLSLIEDVLPHALTLAILIAIVSLLSCTVTDGLIGEKHNSNQELIAEGIANIFCGCFGAVPVAGAVARASNTVKSGGRTPLAGIVHSLVLTLILLFMMPLAGYIPIATLAAILILVAYNMSNWKEFIYMAGHAPKSDCLILFSTFLAGVLVDLLFAVEIGVLISAILFMRRMSQVTVVREWHYLDKEAEAVNQTADDEYYLVAEGIQVFEIEGPMFFASISECVDLLPKVTTSVVILRMRSVTAIDITAIHHLSVFLKRCREQGIMLLLSHVNQHPYQVMERAGFVAEIGVENFCANIKAALARAERLVSAASKD